MPKTEHALKRRIIEQNISRTHHRLLEGQYGYNHILATDLVAECIQMYEAKNAPVRILDIGCGDGFALAQLKSALEAQGFQDSFEFFGMGLNDYDQMYIPRENFIRQGVFGGGLKTKPYDLIFSVYTFQYVWHKLESVEIIYNQLLADNGMAILHFPGYLVSFSEKFEEEVAGNADFADYVQQWNFNTENPPLSYQLVPYYSDDEDRELFTEFGNLRFCKDPQKQLQFPAVLTAFGIYDEGFIFNAVDKNLSYVSSIYDLDAAVTPQSRLPSAPGSTDRPLLCRIVTQSKTYFDKTYNMHLGIHPLSSKVIVGIYPAARDDLSGDAVPYKKMAMSIQSHAMGAVVRCNGLYNPALEFHDFNDFFVHQFMEYILKHAEEICGHPDPDVYLIGYSTGGSAIASIASEFEQIKKLLLIAPSFDSDKHLLRHSMNQFQGELHLVAGDRDTIVLPEQVAWFYHQAEQARVRRFVEFDLCEHSFSGEHNQQLLLKAPLWAFGNLTDFSSEVCVEDVYPDR